MGLKGRRCFNETADTTLSTVALPGAAIIKKGTPRAGKDVKKPEPTCVGKVK